MHADQGGPLNAFCVDLEEWFHICAADTPYTSPSSWNAAPVHVVDDTERLASMLEEEGVRGTFLTVGWVAERHPKLVERLSRAGHEIGCHSYWHRLVYETAPDDFREDIARCLGLLREISAQPVSVFRAPGFSMIPACFWAYPILRELGITTDVSIVPATRNHGGIANFTRDPFVLHTRAGAMRVLPVSTMQIAGKTMPFSGGGYLRLFPLPLVRWGIRQNHREGRACSTYIHPREINTRQPRLKLSPVRYFMHYVGIAGAERKLRALLRRYRFGTVSAAADAISTYPEYDLDDVACEMVARRAG